MPLYQGATDQIRANLNALRDGLRPPMREIGYLTEVQFEDLNKSRWNLGLHRLEQNELLFIGRHLYKSRAADGYSVEDMVDQITSALAQTAVVSITQHWSRIENLTPRSDRYGNYICDRGILEMTARKPRAEFFSVIPKGDSVKPINLKPA